MKKFVTILVVLILNINTVFAYTPNGINYFDDGNTDAVVLDYGYSEGYSKWSSNNPGSTYQGVKSATFYRSANVTDWTCKGRVGNKSSSNNYGESEAFSTYGVLTPAQAETEAAKHAYYKTNTYTWTYTYDYTYWDTCTTSETSCWRDYTSVPGCTLDHWAPEGDSCGFSGFNCQCPPTGAATGYTCSKTKSGCKPPCTDEDGGWCASGYWTCSSSEPCLKGAKSDRKYPAGEYCYIERNGTGGTWSAWSDWTQTPLNETASQKVETITLYSYPLSYKYEYSTFAESNENINFGTYNFDTYTYQSFVYNSKTYHFYYVPALQVCRIKNNEADQEYVSQMRGYAWVNDTSPIAKKNSAFELTVDVIAATPTKYQWQKSINGTVWNNISGATSAKLNTTASVDGTLYRCVVNDTIISNNARLIVK